MIQKIFGFDQNTNIGLYSYATIQCAPALSEFMAESFPKQMQCLIPCAIDQDPFFRLCRDIAPKLGFPKPALLHSKFIPGLQGYGKKMSSSSEQNSTITLADSRETIKKKINKYAFSGGQVTLEEHRAKGGNCAIDVSYAYLEYFLEDDEELEKIRQDYTSGKMLTGELKKKCIDTLASFIEDFQEKRKKVTNEDVDRFMSYRKMNF